MAIHPMFFSIPNPPPSEAGSNNIITQTRLNTTTEVNIANNYYRRYIIMWVYSSAEMQAAFGKTSATISGLRFFVNQQPTHQPFPDYAIGMKNGSFGTSTPGNTGYTIVKSPAPESFTTNQTKTFLPLTTPFTWTGGDLAIVFAWGQSPTNWSSSGQSGVGAGTSWVDLTDSAGSYVINTSNPISTRSTRPVIQLYG